MKKLVGVFHFVCFVLFLLLVLFFAHCGLTLFGWRG